MEVENDPLEDHEIHYKQVVTSTSMLVLGRVMNLGHNQFPLSTDGPENGQSDVSAESIGQLHGPTTQEDMAWPGFAPKIH